MKSPRSNSDATKLRICPLCGELAAKLTDSRSGNRSKLEKPTPIRADVTIFQRYYKCTNSNCGGTFSTREVYTPQSNLTWFVERRSHASDGGAGEYESFDLNKIYGSLTKAAHAIEAKRLWAVTQAVVALLHDVDTFPRKVAAPEKTVLSTEQIGEAVMLALLDFGMVVPWMRYALVFYRRERDRSIHEVLAYLVDTYLDHERKLMKMCRQDADRQMELSWERIRERKIEAHDRSIRARVKKSGNG